MGSHTIARVYPEVNDLVRVSSGHGDPDEIVRIEGDTDVVDIASRIEDLENDRDGLPNSYTLAAPWFTGDLIPPPARTPFTLSWTQAKGVYRLPVAYRAMGRTPAGLGLWLVEVDGPPYRDERRRYVRVPWRERVELFPRTDFEALSTDHQHRDKVPVLREMIADGLHRLDTRCINVSEGGLLVAGRIEPLAHDLPVRVAFTLDGEDFETFAVTVWSLEGEHEGRQQVLTALRFESDDEFADLLRPKIFKAQLLARREGLI